MKIDPSVLFDMSARDGAVYFVVTTYIQISGGKICADDPRIYNAVDIPGDHVRESILSLVRKGLFKAGDGYLREPGTP